MHLEFLLQQVTLRHVHCVMFEMAWGPGPVSGRPQVPGWALWDQRWQGLCPCTPGYPPVPCLTLALPDQRRQMLRRSRPAVPSVCGLANLEPSAKRGMLCVCVRARVRVHVAFDDFFPLHI